jgi:phage tail sheath protein FI
MGEYLAPGVFYERVDATAPAVAVIRTDVTGFVGIAERGPLDRAVPIESWRQFQATFGSFIGSGFLAYTVRAFFENGGRRCWVVRVASPWAAPAATELRDDQGLPAWRLEASSPGVWGDALDVNVREVRRAQTVSDPARSAPEAIGVASVSGFAPDTLVRLSQDGLPPVYRVVRAADAVAGSLVFWDPEPRRRRSYDAPVSGLDLGRTLLLESVAYQVLVREDARLVRVLDDLSPVPDHPRYGPALLPVPEVAARLSPAGADPTTSVRPPEAIAIRELRDVGGQAPLVRHGLTVDPTAVLPLTGGADGLATLAVEDFVGEPFAPEDPDDERARKRRGLRALEEIGEIGLIAVPDILVQPEAPPQLAPLPPCPVDLCRPAPPPAPAPRPRVAGDQPPRFGDGDVFRVQQAMIAQCERRRDRVALLDPPFGAARADGLGLGAAIAWRGRFDTQFAALSYPWLRVRDPLGGGGALRALPAAGHVAGVCAATDLNIGVHKAPANVALGWVQDTTVAVDDASRGVLNPLGINAIAAIAGRGVRILGARTMSSDPDWIHLSVRRLLIMIEKALGLALAWAAFEPNDFVTRTKLHLCVTTFLLSLWQRSALAGASPEEAFMVKCDEENNPPALRARGELHLDVAVAPSIPFEFVVLRVGRVDNEFAITEVAGGVSGRAGNWGGPN